MAPGVSQELCRGCEDGGQAGSPGPWEQMDGSLWGKQRSCPPEWRNLQPVRIKWNFLRGGLQGSLPPALPPSCPSPSCLAVCGSWAVAGGTGLQVLVPGGAGATGRLCGVPSQPSITAASVSFSTGGGVAPTTRGFEDFS